MTQLKGIFKRQHGKVSCPGCNKEIQERDDFSEIEYVNKKRDTVVYTQGVYSQSLEVRNMQIW